MNQPQEKFARFQDWKSEKTTEGQYSASNGMYPGKIRTTISSVSEKVQRGLESGSASFRRIRKSLKSNSFNSEFASRQKILDPQGPFLQRWNKIFVLSCVIAVSLDPLFFYVPVIDDKKKCLSLDSKMEITASVLRSFTDIFYILHIIFEFRTGFIAPSSRVFGRGVLVEDTWAIAKRYLLSYFLIDILAVLPLPQVVILIIIPKMGGSSYLNTKNLLKFVVIFQYVPRFVRIYPLYKEVTTSGILTETAWAGAAFNLFLYMLASHVLGAFWYLFSIERETNCWRKACGKNPGCKREIFFCDGDVGDVTFLDDSCPIQTPNETIFNFGIFLDALQSGVVLSSMDFPQKFFYCFWWGLQNLSSLGQNLHTSTYVWEICFAVFISIFGLVLFSFLIGNMQTYLQSTTTRLEEMRIKRRDAEQWMSHRLLPDNLRERIRRYEQYRWQETRGVDEEMLVHNLPKDLRRDIKRHLCLALLMRVPMFEKMDEQLLDAMCDRLKPALYTEESYIVREGDPVDEMLFVMRGKLLTMTTNGGRTGFFNSEYLKAGDFCGEELLTWALDPHSSSNLPISTRTVQTITEVEAFALMASDLKFVASQFRRLHSKQLRHTFRLYSQQWRTWAACFIQAAWRRYSKKKLEESLRQEENRLQDALAKTGASSPSLGATIYASRFAANALRALRRGGNRKARVPDRVPPMLLQKPAEPDFTEEE
ncbi:CYCLIC NUCLEOTIDE-GATED ION CHANNEL-LIKE PROTEIN [Salix purpurea]|nr:CYCLIC NUCLEOTIDE-GATED ION CHANNEL-LIKE PROTEIN [Salix purpurea]KAJ6760282.1 CYCLIC NUCLEOTIDE-GATED ION CHANNEL-LIKE PROTEIN [Salix purpurea]KAJ6760283.1 CYCLIC NUCLEOTIDE-GATED ION CHANNEL-LIKE PROTEIN [Salix purpurea]